MLLTKTDPYILNNDHGGVYTSRSRRYLPSVSLKVFNRDTGERIGPIGNISLTGLMLQTSKNLVENTVYPFALILPVKIKGANSVAFDARCVWHYFNESNQVHLAGFILDSLTDKNQGIIQTLINSYAN
jgi:hypothetical protein